MVTSLIETPFMSREPTFVDYNVLVYAYDTDAGVKHDAARAWLRSLWAAESGLVSTQVLQEFYVTVTRKVSRPLPRATAREVVATYGAWPIHRPDADDVVAASELEERHHLSFWDSLIIVSASRSGARVLLTEDLQEGRRFDDLVIVSPFSNPSPETLAGLEVAKAIALEEAPAPPLEWVAKDLRPRVDLDDKDAVGSILDDP